MTARNPVKAKNSVFDLLKRKIGIRGAAKKMEDLNLK